jgi:hypothetical protein
MPRSNPQQDEKYCSCDPRQTHGDFHNKIGPSRHSRLGRETVAIGEKQTLIFTGAEPLGTD